MAATVGGAAALAASVAPQLFTALEGWVDKPTHREYVIRSSFRDTSYVVQRRYNEFAALHDVLVAKWMATDPYSNSDRSGFRGPVLPDTFPVPRLFVHTTHSLDERMKALQLCALFTSTPGTHSLD